MLYVLTFGGDPITLEALPRPAAEKAIARLDAWWRGHRVAGRIVACAKLMPPFSATTVRFSDGHPIVVDGPFTTTESEAIGGFGVIDVADLDEAIALVRSWPLAGYVEIRPLMSPTGRVYGYRPESEEERSIR